jgi:uncharacterized membrane protein YeiH
MKALEWTGWFGTAVFAMSGVLAARNKQLDLFGLIVIAAVTALGGGTLRDVLLGSYPVIWVKDPAHLAVTTLAAALSFFSGRFMLRSRTAQTLLYISDALGLAVFTVIGAQKTLELGYSVVIATSMGMITGAAGGMIRDLICGEVPLILRKEIYATAALIGAFAWVALQKHLDEESAAWIAILIIFTIRLLAIQWRLRLPVFQNERNH